MGALSFSPTPTLLLLLLLLLQAPLVLARRAWLAALPTCLASLYQGLHWEA
jgi:hypothetical protein